MAGKQETGIRRTVTFTPWCSRCGWEGKPNQYRGDAAYVLACHNVDRHGGSARIGETA